MNNNNESNVQSQTNQDEEEIITQLTLANLKVLMVRKGDQIIYKLPNNMQVSSIAEEQRQQLMNEIQSIHAATMQAAANAQQQQQQQQQQNNEPSSSTILDKPPQPTTAEFDAMKETARTLREEFERQQQQNTRSDYDCPSPSSADGKNTRRYNKTGKYSKKRQLSQNQTGPQQFIALQPSIQPQPNIMSGTSTPIQSVFPIALNENNISSQQQAPTSSILSKRLPEEEIQHREIKKRFFNALLSDRQAVTLPNYDKPFLSVKDAIDRLLPYHIYQYPKEDLNANQTLLEKQDETTIEIFKCQVDMFEKHAKIVDKDDNSLKVLINRQIATDLRQKLAEEQSRIAAEQATQKQEMLRIQSEKTRIAEQQARQHMSPQQVLNFHQQQPQAQASFSNRLAQANALLQNPEFINYYSQLSPESQQNLLRNREQLVALLEKQQLNQ